MASSAWLKAVGWEEGGVDGDLADARPGVEVALVGQQVDALDDEADLLRRQGVLQFFQTLVSDATAVAAQRPGEAALVHDPQVVADRAVAQVDAVGL